MSKVIWFFNHESTTPSTGYGGRTYYLAQELKKLGYEVVVFQASHHHLVRDNARQARNERIDGVEFVRFSTFKYERPTSPIRIINWVLFSIRMLALAFTRRAKPNYIIYSSPQLISSVSAYLLSKRFGAHFSFEVRDIWPRTLVELSSLTSNSLFIKALRGVELFAYKKSDLIISNISNFEQYLVENDISPEKFLYLPSGVSASEVESPESLSAETQAQFDQLKDKFIVGYVGTLGNANALEPLIDAALLLPKNSNVCVVFVGGGASKPELQQRAGCSDRIVFLPAVPKAQVQSVLASMNVLYLGWHDKTLYKYGVGANKLPEYLYAGKPILHSYSGCGDAVNDIGAGITVASENADQISEAVDVLSKMAADELCQMGARGHQYVQDQLLYEQLAEKLLERISNGNGSL